MRILGIESSCDETAAAVVDDGRILSSLVATQHDVHAKYGGVVPELASRRHLENIAPLVYGALKESKLKISDLEGVSVTCAPGLLGSLLVGIAAAKGIAYAAGIPIIGVNHLEGHLSAPWMEFGEIPLPAIGLVVSGGHTSLYLVRGFGDYKLLGATRDDAAGEAFDKVAKLLGLGYPGGPAIDEASQRGNPKAFHFNSPRFADENSLDFSFSGIKTAVMLTIRKESSDERRPSTDFVTDLAASFQSSVVRMISDRLFEAARRHEARSVILAGGVAANGCLRKKVKEAAEAAGLSAFVPSMDYCTDNAAMIAWVGERRMAAGERSDLKLNATASLEIGV